MNSPPSHMTTRDAPPPLKRPRNKHRPWCRAKFPMSSLADLGIEEGAATAKFKRQRVDTLSILALRDDNAGSSSPNPPTTEQVVPRPSCVRPVIDNDTTALRSPRRSCRYREQENKNQRKKQKCMGDFFGPSKKRKPGVASAYKIQIPLHPKNSGQQNLKNAEGIRAYFKPARKQ